jgi:CheY-like chemotaxis protein
MTNIALNARDAMPHGGTLSIAARNVILGATPGERLPDSLPAGPYVEISFTDTGEGMSPEVLEHALDPFFTTKDRGTGLGLSMVYGFATGSGGHVELFSPPGDETAGKGTVVRMWLPRAPVEPAAKASDAALAPPCARGTETLLVVEDQQEVRDVLEKALRALGYQVLSAADGNEALNILDSDRHIDLMVSDIVMPGGISGTELAARARQRWPELAIVLATGFADALRTRSTELPDGVRVIAKPYRPAKIASAIRAALDSNALRPA